RDDLAMSDTTAVTVARGGVRWAAVLAMSASLVLVGPTSFPRDVDTDCPGPELMWDGEGSCLERGTLIVMPGEPSQGLGRDDLERTIAPLGGRIDQAVDLIELYAVEFRDADTLA